LPTTQQYERLRANHICPSCWVRQAPEGYVQCEPCRVYKKQRQRQVARQAKRDKEA
jgi:hypothetical protein